MSKDLSAIMDEVAVNVTDMMPGNETESKFFMPIGQLYALMVMLGLLSLLGVLGNATVMCVFSQRSDQLVSTFFILTMAVVDMTVCAVIIPFTIYMEYVNYEVSSEVACRLYHFLITSNIPFSSFIMVAIALDRYFSICWPFTQAMNIWRAKLLIASLTVFGVAIGTVVALVFDVEDVKTYENGTSITRTYCKENTNILSANFQMYYQKFHLGLFPACLLIVVVLYVLIYRSVMVRRNLRQRQKSRSLYIVQAAASEQQAENGKSCEMTLINQVPKDTSIRAQNGQERRIESLRKMSKDRLRMANMKTAAMLFVVTVVFFVTFLPAFLMLTLQKIIPTNMVVFYMYFANNVANPVIYSFMNQNFRDDLKNIFCTRYPRYKM